MLSAGFLPARGFPDYPPLNQLVDIELGRAMANLHALRYRAICNCGITEQIVYELEQKAPKPVTAASACDKPAGPIQFCDR